MIFILLSISYVITAIIRYYLFEYLIKSGKEEKEKLIVYFIDFFYNSFVCSCLLGIFMIGFGTIYSIIYSVEEANEFVNYYIWTTKLPFK